MFAWCETCTGDSPSSCAREHREEEAGQSPTCGCCGCEDPCCTSSSLKVEEAARKAKDNVEEFLHSHVVEPIENGIGRAKAVKQQFKEAMEQWAEREIYRQVEHVVDKLPHLAMNLFEDAHMPRFASRAKDRAIALAWPDLRDEIMMLVALTLDAKDNVEHEVEVPNCFQRSLRYHILPYDRSLWGRWRDPIWIVFTLCSIAPLSVVPGVAFLVLLLAIDKSDEYQLLHFILHCKSSQFVSFGVLGGFWGFLDYVGCITLSGDDGRYACESVLPSPAVRFAFLLMGWVYQNSIICAAFVFLSCSREKGRFSLEGNIEIQNTSSAEAAGGHMWRFLVFDFISFFLCVGLYITLASVTTGSVLANDWRLVHILFACQVIYGYLSLPFFLCRLPVLHSLLTHSWATGYNQLGVCCRFIGRRGARPAPLEQGPVAPEPKEEEQHEELFSRAKALFSWKHKQSEEETEETEEEANDKSHPQSGTTKAVPHGVWRPACLIAMVEATQGTRTHRKFSEIMERWVKRKAQRYIDRLLDRLPGVLKFLLEDADMPRAISRGKDRAVDLVWPDVHAEIILQLGGMIDKDKAVDNVAASGPGPDRLRSFLRYHFCPCDKSLFTMCRDPMWVIFRLAPLIPWQGACPLVYFFVFLIIDKSDEYQLLAFILKFKGTLFISNGLVLKVVGQFQFLFCAISQESTCEETGPGSAGSFVLLLGGWLLQIFMVWAAFLLLPCSQEKGRPKMKGHLEAVRTAETVRGGGYIRHLLAYDVLCLSGCITAYVVLVGSAADADFDGWQSRQLLFVCRVVYGYLSMPFFIFTLPVFQNVLTHSVPTAYDRQGRCCRYVGLKKSHDPPAQQEPAWSLPIHEENANTLLGNVKALLHQHPPICSKGGAAAADPHEDRAVMNDPLEGGTV